MAIYVMSDLQTIIYGVICITVINEDGERTIKIKRKEKIVMKTVSENFFAVKEAYILAREDERKIIIDHLKKHGYKKENGSELDCRGGSGKKNYTSGGLLDISFDLSNWKYVEILKDNNYFLVSLQSFDKDKHSGNKHVLMDRLGIFSKSHSASYDPEKIFNDMVITSIDLPMTEEKLKKLIEQLENLAQ